MLKQKISRDLSQIINKGGPDNEEYEMLNQIMNEIAEGIIEKDLDISAIEKVKNQSRFLNDEKSIMGHIRAKPFGYAGDYSIIDRIYTMDTSESYYKWDCYSLLNSAAIAVRNRKEYFKNLAAQLLNPNGNLLNIASGPGRDLCELYDENPNLEITTTCIEIDPRAIKYSRKINKAYLDKIKFIRKNILRYQTKHKYDLIWSAGLFDYFDDKTFVWLLKRFKSWLKPKGQVVIGNFNENHNPSRPYMELFGEWFLNHRTEEQLISLAKEAGVTDSKIRIECEPENVNLFLHITHN